jgi:cytochrome b6
MTFCHRPSVAGALASAERIVTSVDFGWLIRSIHRCSASVMALLTASHVFRVCLTGGFKEPRESTSWVTGVTSAAVTVSFGATGHFFPWDQVGFWACEIVTGVPAAVPTAGPPSVLTLPSGDSVGQSALTRFCGAHAFAPPLAALSTHSSTTHEQGASGPS